MIDFKTSFDVCRRCIHHGRNMPCKPRLEGALPGPRVGTVGMKGPNMEYGIMLHFWKVPREANFKIAKQVLEISVRLSSERLISSTFERPLSPSSSSLLTTLHF